MQAGEIPRIPFTAFDDEMIQFRAKLAIDAKDKLGYKIMALAVATPSSLMAALRKLDIAPLSNIGVERYKHSKEKVHIRRSDIILSVWWMTIVPAAIALGGGLIGYVHHTKFPGYSDWDAPWYLIISCISSFIAICVLIGLSCFYTWGEDGYTTPRKLTMWWKYELATYPGSIPEHVLEKALAIKNACPKVQFYIEHLVTAIDKDDANEIRMRKDRILRMRDPFLVASLDHETYYIDVWDEKDYERSFI